MSTSSNSLPRPQLWKEEIELLKEMASLVPNQGNIVEIGTAQGGGTAILAQSAAPEVHIHSYDPAPGQSAFALQNIFSNVSIHSMSSVEGVAAWSSSISIDLLIIDGSHRFENVFEDYNLWLPHLSANGTILFHDYDLPPRGGASHPGVHVFCSTLLKIGNLSQLARKGRYLALAGEFNKVSFIECHEQAIQYIKEIVDINRMLRSKDEDAERIISLIDRHSRLGKHSSKEDNDLLINTHLLDMLMLNMNAFLPLVPSPPLFFKWTEALEMALASWGASSPECALRLVERCKNEKELSAFLAGLNAVVIMIEHVAEMTKPLLRSGPSAS